MKYVPIIIVFALVVGTRTAAAEDVQPWATGVSEATQEQAKKLFDEGNQLFGTQAHGPAVDKFKAALAIWDHPLIRFNLAATLIRLDRMLDAADELEKALRFGDRPFKPELYQQALDYQALLKRQVGYVEASCNQAGAHVTLDGKPWFNCPGTKKERVMAGEHAIVGEHKGYLTSSQRVVVAGGASAIAKIELVSLESATTVKYRFRPWLPWPIVGGGVAIAAAGLGFFLNGRSHLDDYQRLLDNACASGCPASLDGEQYFSLRDARDTGTFNQRVGVAMMGAGGAIVVTGAVMFIINRPQKVMPNVEIAPKRGGAAASVTWRY